MAYFIKKINNNHHHKKQNRKDNLVKTSGTGYPILMICKTNVQIKMTYTNSRIHNHLNYPILYRS
jgi:hypothetical protein